MLIGSIFVLVFPSAFFIDPIKLALLSLMVLLVSNALVIPILLKWKSFNYQPPLSKNSKYSPIFLLLLLLVASVSIIEIVVTIIDFGLNLIHVDPTLASPYDEYFNTPINLLGFMILITIFGPILEELIFRRYTISTILNQCQSKFLVICTSALIFSLSHTVTNLATSVRYAILHFFATFILGIILAIIFLRWGLKYAILFHSFWNFYSLIVQLLINDGAFQMVDLMISLSMIVTFFLAVPSIFRLQRVLDFLSEVILPSRTIILFTSLNFLLIITYELIFPLILLIIPPDIKAGLTFIYQACTFLVATILIDKENKRMKRFKIDLNLLYNEVSLE